MNADISDLASKHLWLQHLSVSRRSIDADTPQGTFSGGLASVKCENATRRCESSLRVCGLITRIGTITVQSLISHEIENSPSNVPELRTPPWCKTSLSRVQVGLWKPHLFRSMDDTCHVTEVDVKLATAPPIMRSTRIRRVRFLVNSYDDIEEEKFFYEHVEPHEKVLCYLIPGEIKNQRQETIASARTLSQQQSEYEPILASLLDMSVAAGSLLVEHQDVRLDEARWVLRQAPELRGQESRVSMVLVRYKVWANQSVLHKQQSLLHENVENYRVLLRQWCEQVNKCTRDLALLFAQIDEAEAWLIHHETSI